MSQEIILVNKNQLRKVIRDFMPLNTLDGQKLSLELAEAILEKFVVIEKWVGND